VLPGGVSLRIFGGCGESPTRPAGQLVGWWLPIAMVCGLGGGVLLALLNR